MRNCKEKILLFTVIFFLQHVMLAQVSLPLYPDSVFSIYYHQRVSLFRSLPSTNGDIIFVGNSITDGNEWVELFNDSRIKNRGISGDISAGVLHRLDEISERKPRSIFLMIGTNDLARNIPVDSVLKNILLSIDFLRQHSPSTHLFVQSILPVNNEFGKFDSHTNKGASILKLNTLLKGKAVLHQYRYIDLYSSFSDGNGKLKSQLTNDGLHLNGEAYLLWKHLIYPYVYQLQDRPALLPMPQSITWRQGLYPLGATKSIFIKDTLLVKEAGELQQYLQQIGYKTALVNSIAINEPYIELRLDEKLTSPLSPAEAYRISVDSTRIIITAQTAHGIFNGIQTLRQLMRSGVMVDACEIVDWPAFAWRGFMVDVGRNYQSMRQLKQQIDVMASYKLNVFHFHATEDIAWRIASKRYPQLTAPEHVLRDKGLYYSETEIKELINYCRDRHISFVPEIDMPGHSDAFTRAMGFNMQADSGLAVVKNIIREFIDTYDLPYLHIGADEVKITNQNFIPEVTSLIEGLGKKVIGWEPGGNFTRNTIRQLWMDDQARLAKDPSIRFIDSRHLYLNHMDPLESVVTIYNRKIGNKEKGDASLMGATLCIWHDRSVADEKDILKMNPVYPGMLAFAERTWQGGGQKEWLAVIGEEGSDAAKAFAAFEQRLIDHQQQYFSDLPFPYTQQSSLKWNLYGPFDNGGDLDQSFSPELTNIHNLPVYATVVGGTIIWRHWGAPLIKGALQQPAENTTWYASSRIWSDDDEVKRFWIGFNNLSRSPATDSPMPHTWDNHRSKVWVNGILISPPVWKRAGLRGHPEIPLTDEGYEYREPVTIKLKKGWNDVLIKSPVGSFKGKDWQNPVKWMFTFVPLSGIAN